MKTIAQAINDKADAKARLARTSPQTVFNDDGTNQSVGVLPHTHSEYAVLSGASEPTTSTTGTLGQFYLETTTPTLYQCTDTTTEYTWTKIGGGGGSYTLPQATETVLGGIKAAEKTTETAEVKIDTASGKLYVPAAGEAQNGVAAGGTTGQIYAKIDGTDYNAEWVDAPSGGNSVNLALGKTYTKTAAATSYPDTNNAEMTDGRKAGTTAYTSPIFTGWQNTNIEIVIDLESLVSVKRGIVYGLSDTASGMYIPYIVEVLTSTDNVNFTSRATVNPSLTTGLYFYTIKADFSEASARYVKFAITRQTGKEWIFLDEIEAW